MSFTLVNIFKRMKTDAFRDALNSMFSDAKTALDTLRDDVDTLQGTAVTTSVLADYVQKEDGKGLSELSFTTSDSNQLSSLASAVSDLETDADTQNNAIIANADAITANVAAATQNASDIAANTAAIAANLGMLIDDTADALPADATNFMKMRYVEVGGESQMQVCLRTGTDTYAWSLVSTQTIV